MNRHVPDVSVIQPQQTLDEHLILRFQNSSFKNPFIARYVSNGTIKIFAYLILLNNPKPYPLLAMKKPKNQLYPKLLLNVPNTRYTPLTQVRPSNGYETM